MVFNLEYPYEDEAFYSWMIRMYNKSTFTKPNKFLMEVFGEVCKMYHDGIGCLEELGKRQGLDTDELNQVMIKNSLLALIEPFQHPRIQGYNQRWILGERRGMIRFDKKPTYKVCPICYLRDMETKGEAYLRIYHQMQGVLVCAEHRVDLIEVVYDSKQLEPIYIERLNITKTYLKNKHYERFAHAVATILRNDTLNGLDSIKCYEKYKRRLKAIYQIDNLEVMGHQEMHVLEYELVLYYGIQFLEDIDCGKQGKIHYNWFVRVLTNTEVGYEPTKPIHYLLVNDFLFRDLDVFKQY